jgi:hypothetical protein
MFEKNSEKIRMSEGKQKAEGLAQHLLALIDHNEERLTPRDFSDFCRKLRQKLRSIQEGLSEKA